MTKNSQTNQTTNQTVNSLNVMRELADTTWRMAVPVIFFAALGILADILLKSKPWLTLVGMVIGFGFAALLVKRQLDRYHVAPLSAKDKAAIKKRNAAYDAENEDKDYYNDTKSPTNGDVR